jgi:chromate reductase, NAD(P)H dehydrogenase (quinone)
MKVVLLMSASTGSLGGLRNLYALRQMLTNIKCLVLPDLLAVSHAAKAFDSNGTLINEKDHAILERMIKHYLDIASRLKA